MSQFSVRWFGSATGHVGLFTPPCGLVHCGVLLSVRHGSSEFRAVCLTGQQCAVATVISPPPPAGSARVPGRRAADSSAPPPEGPLGARVPSAHTFRALTSVFCVTLAGRCQSSVRVLS